ncbi:endochitinase 4-like [Cryptomeria japonica]|uniref:endochitinase 4-like n=1 Tax=Cryptomeria japonica TaxID=3369 RepID=UPI0027DA122A|nr:endochitinase 4-like [Cryptomeria japonica]
MDNTHYVLHVSRQHMMAIQNSKSKSKIFWSSLACVLLVLFVLVDVGVSQTSGGVGSIVSSDVLNSVVGGAASGCAGNGFYNYDSFINAANAFIGFGTSGSSDVNKREVAAFFLAVLIRRGSLYWIIGFCYIEEQNPSSIYCDASNTQYPCTPGKSYHGRGRLQLSWNYNYGVAENYIQFDGLNNPEIVGTGSTISFKTAVWFGMVNSNCHTAITSGQGFGATIRAINSMESDGGSDATVSSRVNYFQKFCQQLNVDPGSNLRC